MGSDCHARKGSWTCHWRVGGSSRKWEMHPSPPQNSHDCDLQAEITAWTLTHWTATDHMMQARPWRDREGTIPTVNLNISFKTNLETKGTKRVQCQSQNYVLVHLTQRRPKRLIKIICIKKYKHYSVWLAQNQSTVFQMLTNL